MIDSVLTLTWRAVAWIVFFLAIWLGIDRAVAAIGGPPLSFFALVTVMLLAFLVVAGVYTAGKWALGRMRREGR